MNRIETSAPQNERLSSLSRRRTYAYFAYAISAASLLVIAADVMI